MRVGDVVFDSGQHPDPRVSVPGVLGALGDGRLAFTIDETPIDAAPDGARLRWPRSIKVQATPDAAVLSPVLEVRTAEVVIRRDPPRFPFTSKAVEFGPHTVVRALGEHIVVGDTEADEIVVCDPYGKR